MSEAGWVIAALLLGTWCGALLVASAFNDDLNELECWRVTQSAECASMGEEQ